MALINGTQFSTAYALSALFDAWRNVEAAVVISALSTDAIMGSTATLAAEIHELRGQRGQIDVAGAMRSLMQALRFAKAIGTGTPAFRIRTASGVNRK